ncbi:MFS transporter [Micromonospora profundi]|uniref:MFS transporter n=1 Tax=Micromonospora profundi TaxID=1420889 RepID=A0AAJ6L4S9_9ACTN|nr:MFS transporter [Micromonospora profundi]WLS48450.1 MFS transporter [Micromonospora profundi]
MSFTVFAVGLNIYVDFDPFWLVVIGYAILFVPFPILSPFAGAFVDRYGHRRALLISNIGTLLNLVALVVVMVTDSGGSLYAVSAAGISTILRTLQLAAIESVVPLLVPKRHYGRANGPRMLMTATFVLAGPLFAYLLLSVASPVVIVMAECLLVVVAIYVVFTSRIPLVKRPDGDAPDQSLWRDVVDAWRHLRLRHGLLTMVGFLALVSGTLGALEITSSGTVMGFSDYEGAIAVSTACWLGMVVATIAMVVWGVPSRLVPGMLAAGLMFAVALAAASFRPDLILMSVSGFIAMGSLAVIIASFQTVVHLKVEPHLLGRVFGLKNTSVTLSHIVGDLGAIVIGVSLLSASFTSNGQRREDGWEEVSSPVLAAFIGNGPGRGWALFMMLIGVGVAAYVAYLRFRSPAFLRMEKDLPDVTPADRLPQPTEDLAPVGVTEPASGGRSA